MDSSNVEKLGKWTAILTLITGIFLIGSYLVNRDVEIGTFIYFYIVLSGIFNLTVFIITLVTSFFTTSNRKELRILASIVAGVYLVLAFISYYIF